MNSYGVLRAAEFDKLRYFERNELRSTGFIVLFFLLLEYFSFYLNRESIEKWRWSFQT